MIDLLKIAGVLIMVLVCNHYVRKPRKPLKRCPVAGDMLTNYYVEFSNLKISISSARTFSQLDYARKFIGLFKSRYLPHQNQLILRNDIDTLRKLYKEKRQSLSIREHLFNEYYC